MIDNYHSNNRKDLARLQAAFVDNILTSSGYLIMPQEPPYLRRGVVAAWKDDSDGSDS